MVDRFALGHAKGQPKQGPKQDAQDDHKDNGDSVNAVAGPRDDDLLAKGTLQVLGASSEMAVDHGHLWWWCL